MAKAKLQNGGTPPGFNFVIPYVVLDLPSHNNDKSLDNDSIAAHGHNSPILSQYYVHSLVSSHSSSQTSHSSSCSSSSNSTASDGVNPLNTHSVITMSKNGIFKPKLFVGTGQFVTASI